MTTPATYHKACVFVFAAVPTAPFWRPSGIIIVQSKSGVCFSLITRSLGVQKPGSVYVPTHTSLHGPGCGELDWLHSRGSWGGGLGRRAGGRGQRGDRQANTVIGLLTMSQGDRSTEQGAGWRPEEARWAGAQAGAVLLLGMWWQVTMNSLHGGGTLPWKLLSRNR